MVCARSVVIGVLGGILLVSGPALGLVDLTSESTQEPLGGGGATVEMVSDPAAGFQFSHGRFGTGVYYLRVPPAVINVSAVDGRPQLSYRVTVPELEYTKSTTRKLDSTDTGRVEVALADRAFAPEPIKKQTYRAEIVVRVQSFDISRVAYHRNVTVHIDR